MEPTSSTKPSEQKTCITCGEVKDLTEFYSHGSGGNRVMSYCKACFLLRRRARHLNKYGLSIAEATILVARECEICGGRTEDMHIDHTYEGSFHGVLCARCNTGIGMFLHSPYLMATAMGYVMRTRGVDPREV